MSNLGVQNKNPGNIKDPATGKFRIFDTPEQGQSALLADLKLKTTGGSKVIKPDASLKQFAQVWAPASDNNNPDQYANTLAQNLGVNTDVPISSLANRLPDFAKAISTAEGTTTLMQQPQNSATGADTSGSSTKSQLSHEQLIGNIGAMEQQGASKDEIQGYLDSLKNTDLTTGADTSVQKFSIPDAPVPQEQSLTNNSFTRGLINLVPGAKTLGDYFGTSFGNDYEKLKGLVGGQDNSKYFDQTMPSPGAVAGATAGLVGTATGIATGGMALDSALSGSALNPTLWGVASNAGSALPSAVETGLRGIGVDSQTYQGFGAGDKVEALTHALSKAGIADKAVIQQEIQQILPTAIQEAGGHVAFSQLHPIIAKLLGLAGKGLGLIGTLGTGAAIGQAYNQFKNNIIPQR